MVQHSLVRYKCEQCDYSALNRQCLRNHIKVQHSDVKPFSCQVNSSLVKHKIRILYIHFLNSIVEGHLNYEIHY